MLRNKEMTTNFETVRGIVKELSGQVQWGPIANNAPLTDALREAFYRHKENGVFDCFEEHFHIPRGIGNRTYHFVVKNNLNTSQVNNMHQFVIDFTNILIKHVEVKELRWYIKFANGHLVEDKFKTDEPEYLKLLLNSMLNFSNKALGIDNKSDAKLFGNQSEISNVTSSPQLKRH